MVHVRMKADVPDHQGSRLFPGDELDVTLEQARGWIGLNKAIIILPVEIQDKPLPPDTVKGKRARAARS